MPEMLKVAPLAVSRISGLTERLLPESMLRFPMVAAMSSVTLEGGAFLQAPIRTSPPLGSPPHQLAGTLQRPVPPTQVWPWSARGPTIATSKSRNIVVFLGNESTPNLFTANTFPCNISPHNSAAGGCLMAEHTPTVCPADVYFLLDPDSARIRDRR